MVEGVVDFSEARIGVACVVLVGVVVGGVERLRLLASISSWMDLVRARMASICCCIFCFLADLATLRTWVSRLALAAASARAASLISRWRARSVSSGSSLPSPSEKVRAGSVQESRVEESNRGVGTCSVEGESERGRERDPDWWRLAGDEWAEVARRGWLLERNAGVVYDRW